MSTDQPQFSIVIPTYNRAHLIMDTLESVFAQTYRNFEVIIVDNCSQDNIEEVLQPHIESGAVNFIRHDQNYERARSRNTGMQNAKGDFVTFLDSDDRLFPNYLSDAAKYVQNNPEADVFHSLYNIEDENGNTVYKIKFPKITNDTSYMVNGNFLSCHAVFISQTVYHSFRFDTNPDLTGHEDYEFWLRVMSQHKLHRLPSYNSALIQHSSRSLAGFTPEETIEQKEYIMGKIHESPSLLNAYKKFLPRLESSFYLYAAIQSNFGKKRKSAFKYLWKSLTKDFSILFSKRYIAAFKNAVTP